MKKYEFTGKFKMFLDKKLFQIRALVSFGSVEAGEIGGYIEKEDNLSHAGNAWVSGDAWVYGDAEVYGNAEVYGDARVYGNAWVYGDARVYGNARVSGDAEVYGDARVYKSTHLLQVGAIGSRDGTTTFFRTKEKEIYVKCGCFEGSIEEFEKKVVTTHAGTKHEKTYKLAIELAKAQIELEEEEINEVNMRLCW